MYQLFWEKYKQSSSFKLNVNISIAFTLLSSLIIAKWVGNFLTKKPDTEGEDDEEKGLKNKYKLK